MALDLRLLSINFYKTQTTNLLLYTFIAMKSVFLGRLTSRSPRICQIHFKPMSIFCYLILKYWHGFGIDLTKFDFVHFISQQ